MTFPSALKKSSVQSYFLTFFKDGLDPIYDSQRYHQTANLTCGLQCFFFNFDYLLILFYGTGKAESCCQAKTAGYHFPLVPQLSCVIFGRLLPLSLDMNIYTK